MGLADQVEKGSRLISRLANSVRAIASPPKAGHDSSMPPLPNHLRKETLGYQIHTNRELDMMLRREKPHAKH